MEHATELYIRLAPDMIQNIPRTPLSGGSRVGPFHNPLLKTYAGKLSHVISLDAKEDHAIEDAPSRCGTWITPNATNGGQHGQQKMENRTSDAKCRKSPDTLLTFAFFCQIPPFLFLYHNR